MVDTRICRSCDQEIVSRNGRGRPRSYCVLCGDRPGGRDADRNRRARLRALFVKWQIERNLAIVKALPSSKERRKIRERAGWSQEQLGRHFGVGVASVRAWESGRAEPV